MKQDRYDKLIKQINDHFEEEFKASESFKPTLKNTTDPTYKGSRSLTHKWQGLVFSQYGTEPKNTGYDKEKIINIAKASAEHPESFNVHPRIQRHHLGNRIKGI